MNPYGSGQGGGGGYGDGRSGGNGGSRGYSRENQYNGNPRQQQPAAGYGYPGYVGEQQASTPPSSYPQQPSQQQPQQHGGGRVDDYRRTAPSYSHSAQHQGYSSPKESSNNYGVEGHAHHGAGGNGNYGYAMAEGYGGHATSQAQPNPSHPDSYSAYSQQYYYQQQAPPQQQQQQQGQPQDGAAQYYTNYYYQTPPNGGMIGGEPGGVPGGPYGNGQGYYQPYRGGRGGRGGGGYHPSQRYGQEGGRDEYLMNGGPSRQFGYRGAGWRGGAGGFRGGRGGAYSPYRTPQGFESEYYCLLHVDSFATLHNACRREAIQTLFPSSLRDQAASGALGSGNPRFSQRSFAHYQQPQTFRYATTLRALVIVEKQYLAASISVPKDVRNIILSENTARKFLNMKDVLNENSQPLVEMEHGSKLPKSLYLQLRSGIVQLLSIDKSEAVPSVGPGEDEVGKKVSTDPAAEREIASLTANPSLAFDYSADKLLEYLLTRYSVLSVVEECLKEESERSVALFGRLLEQSCKWRGGKGGWSTAVQNDEDAEEDEGDEDESSADRQQASEDAFTSTNNQQSLPGANGEQPFRRRAHPMLRTPHGVFLLRLGMESPTKRALFFNRMEEEMEMISRSPHHTAPDGSLFVVFFASILTCPLVFKCFGLEFFGELPEDQHWSDQERITQIMCSRLANEGIVLVRSTGGGAVLTALLHAQRPQYSYIHPPGSSYRRREVGSGGAGSHAEERSAATGAGGHRKRRREDEQGGSGMQQYKAPIPRKEGTDFSTSGPGGDGTIRPEEENASRRGIRIAPASLEEYDVPPPPKDWRLLEAVVEAFCTGRIPERIPNPQAVGAHGVGGSGYSRGGRGRGRGRGAGIGDTGTDGENGMGSNVPSFLPVALTKEEISLDYRIPLLTDHVISCRALQIVLPPMADVILSFEKEEKAKLTAALGTDGGSASISSPLPPFVQKCCDFLESIIRRGRELMVQPFGNYVAQTFLTEFSSRAIPGTRVEALVKDLLQLMQSSFLEFCMDKCASNVLDRAIVATTSIPHEGYSFLFQSLRALVHCPDSQMLSVVSNQYGNYVVIHVLQHIDELLEWTSLNKSTLQGAQPLAAVKEEARQLETQFAEKARRQLHVLKNIRFAFGLVKWLEAYTG